MPLGYEYKRYFIILQEEDKGYEMTAGKIPTGYVKIEIKKNKVKTGGFIQNMKSDSKSQYKLNLLAPGKKLVLDIGLFRMDGTGRGEFYAEFDSDNVSGSNLPISEFTGALVVAGSGIPLVGYTGRDSIPWRDWYGKEKEKTVEIERQEAKIEIEQIPYIEEIVEPEEVREAEIEEAEEVAEVEEVAEAIEAIEEVREAEAIEAIEEVREAEAIEDIEEVREAEAIEDIEEVREAEAIEQIEEKIEEVERQEVQNQVEQIHYIEEIAEPAPLHYSFHGWDTGSLMNAVEPPERHKKEQKESESKTNKNLLNALRDMERFDGFHDEYGLRWYRIGRELPFLNDVIIPINGAMMPLSYPYIVESTGKDIENCVLGVEHRRGEIRYVYIGIPGAYNQGCKACYEYKGFTGYKRTKNNRKGYWIMCMDIMKGKVCRV